MSSKVKSWLLLTVIFVVGIVTGSALTVGFASHFRHAPGEDDMRNRWMLYLTKKLALTADQQVQIRPIVANAEEQIKTLHRSEVERGSQIIKRADDQISAVLLPDQKVILQKMAEDREKMFRKNVHPWDSSHQNPPDMHHHGGSGKDMPPPAIPETNPPPANAGTNAPPAK
jgi:hypothetical protein